MGRREPDRRSTTGAVTTTDSLPAARPTGVLCLGEAILDLINEAQTDDPADARALVPHFGGAGANVALAAARFGAPVVLAGGAGDDPWGRWLRDRLEDEGVDLSLFTLAADRQTVVALVSIGPGGEPSYAIYGGAPGLLSPVSIEQLDAAIEASGALFLSSNTLVDQDERSLSMRARERALGLERPVIIDPNLRLHRWRSRADAAASTNACVPGALLVRCNDFEAELLTGEKDPERAALALVKAGARLVVITLGEAGAILRGELRADAPGVPVEVLSTVGAGDVLTGFLLARLALTGFYPAAVAAGLREAVALAAEACRRWGTFD